MLFRWSRAPLLFYQAGSSTKGWGNSWCVPSPDALCFKCLTQLRGDQASPEWFALEQAPEISLSPGWHKCWYLATGCQWETTKVLHWVITVQVSDRGTCCARELFVCLFLMFRSFALFPAGRCWRHTKKCEQWALFPAACRRRILLCVGNLLSTESTPLTKD